MAPSLFLYFASHFSSGHLEVLQILNPAAAATTNIQARAWLWALFDDLPAPFLVASCSYPSWLLSAQLGSFYPLSTPFFPGKLPTSICGQTSKKWDEKVTQSPTPLPAS